LVCLTDLFGIATGAAGSPQVREGHDILGMVAGEVPPRDFLVGMYGEPGTPHFKIMVRDDTWKYIYMANGGRQQLFNLREDPDELDNRAGARSDVVRILHTTAVRACDVPGARDALEADDLRSFPYRGRERLRIYQFDRSRGVVGFPGHPADVLEAWKDEG
jgi:choline-sulfatase